MELLDGAADTVHPEVRAHINSLVSALGGVNADDDGQYQLGDDALHVLRDIKRWIRFYDEKTNRMDVARCIHDANLVEGDLLPILAQWPENAMDNKFRARIALACFEVLVPLTWPLERDRERMTLNHHRHMPILELAQAQYSNAIINFDGARILHTAVRAALPSMAIPIGDRTARDQAIIKLVLFFLRNVVLISHPPHAKAESDEPQLSRSATIDAFSYQDIFLFLLTLASNMGDDFRTEDTTVMEIIFHVVKRVDIGNLFINEQQLNQAKACELSAMMRKESAMLKAYNRIGPTRHSRFGTMIWVRRDGGKMSTLLGQDALADPAARAQMMDNKTYKPSRRARKGDKGGRDLGPPAKLNARAYNQLRSFVEAFLDSGFNPLFHHVRKTIDQEAPHVMQYHRRQFFYLVAWFLEAERVRRKTKNKTNQHGDSDAGSFNLVAGVLNQEMFITLNRALHEAYDVKDWHELCAVMRCFTQILLTVQEMAESGNEDDEEVAENVLSRLFYEESTHDVIANIIRNYKAQGFDYLDATTELVHHYLRILEAYSKQNVDMQVRSRKRTRRKKQAAKQAGEGDNFAEANDDSANDEASVERTSKERKFDFHRFASRFTPQGVVDTFTAFARYYRDLNDAQLKRVHRYFYRMAFKQEMGVMLFRVDIIHLLYSMIQGTESLDKSCSMFKEWEALVKQILRKCFKNIEERPELIVEMLFSKLQGTAYFLEHGYEKQTIASKRAARPAVELEFKHTEERERQLAIVVCALLDRGKGDHINWIKGVLAEAESERRSWAAAAEAMPSVEDPFEDPVGDEQPKEPPMYHIRPDSPARRTAMFKNSYLRLLMTVCEFQRLGPASEETADSSWIVPSDISADHLKDSLHCISQAEFSPPTFDDFVLAEHQLKRKAAPRQKAAFDDDEDGEQDDDLLFPAGGPTTHKAIDEAKKPKKTRRRRRGSSAGELDDAALEERARKRREREREKARKIKSALYVLEGDDEFDSDEDAAFFARERAIAERANRAAQSALAMADAAAAPRKRKSSVLLAVSSDEDEEEGEAEDEGSGEADDADASATAPRKRRRVSAVPDDDDDDGDDGDDDDGDDGDDDDGDDDDDDDGDDDDDDDGDDGDDDDGDDGDDDDGDDGDDDDGDDDDDDDGDDDDDDDGDDGDDDDDDGDARAPGRAAAPASADEDADDAPAVAVARRPRVRAGFVMDSDDDD